MTLGMTAANLALGDHTDRRKQAMWIDKKRFLAMEANINRLVYVQQQQQQALESMGVLLNSASEALKAPILDSLKCGSEAENSEKLRK